MFILFQNFYIVHRSHRPQFCYKVRWIYNFFSLMQKHLYYFFIIYVIDCTFYCLFIFLVKITFYNGSKRVDLRFWKDLLSWIRSILQTPSICFLPGLVSDWTVILYFDWSVIYEKELSYWFLFLYSDWWMSDRLKYSYSVPLRTVW